MEIYLRKQLNKFSEIFATTQLHVIEEEDLDVGRTYRVIDSVNDIDDTFLVSKIIMNYPNTKGDIVTVGDELWKTDDWSVQVWDRLKRLEEQQTETTDLLVDYREFEREIKQERRYFLMKKKDRSSDGVNTFILGHHTFGVLGTQELGDAGTSLVDYCLLQGDNTYKEYCYDDTFHDSTNSSATMDTGNQEIDFSSGGIWISKKITYGVSWTYCTITLGNDDGDFTVEVSADGKSNWQEVTTGTKTELTNSTADGFYIRITDSSGFPTAFGTWGAIGGSGSLSPTYDEYGNYDDPAIKAILEE